MLSKLSAVTLTALVLAGQGHAQSITAPAVQGNAKSTDIAAAAAAAKAAQQAAAPEALRPKVVVLSAAGSPAAQSGTVTIAELAANQARKLASQAATTTGAGAHNMAGQQPYRQVVPELLPAAPIAVEMTADSKPAKPARKVAPRQYLASIIGLKGHEIAEFQTGDGTGHTLKAGDSIANWSIQRIVNGKLFLITHEYSKKARQMESKSKVLSVGDTL